VRGQQGGVPRVVLRGVGHRGDDVAQVADLGERGAGRVRGGGARGLEVGRARHEVGAHLLLEVLRLRRGAHPGERAVQGAVDARVDGGAHRGSSSRSRSVLMICWVARQSATLRRYTARPASVIR